MPLMIHGAIIGNRSLDLTPIVVTTTSIELPADRIGVYALANVPLYRKLEITNAWRWLYNGIRDRNILRDFAAGNAYSGVNIFNIGVPNRRTAGDVATFTANDVVVGIGETARATLDNDAIEPLESAFFKLIQVGREYAIEQAA